MMGNESDYGIDVRERGRPAIESQRHNQRETVPTREGERQATSDEVRVCEETEATIKGRMVRWMLGERGRKGGR